MEQTLQHTNSAQDPSKGQSELTRWIVQDEEEITEIQNELDGWYDWHLYVGEQVCDDATIAGWQQVGITSWQDAYRLEYYSEQALLTSSPKDLAEVLGRLDNDVSGSWVLDWYRDRHESIRGGVDEGLAEIADLCEWMNAGFISWADAQTWIEAEFDPEEAQRWEAEGLEAADAAEWREEGYTAEQAGQWVDEGVPAHGIAAARAAELEASADEETSACYYICMPRNFYNEYTIYVASTPETIAWCEDRVHSGPGGFRQIGRSKAIHYAFVGSYELAASGIPFSGRELFGGRSNGSYEEQIAYSARQLIESLGEGAGQ
jgi:hypothetical protein